MKDTQKDMRTLKEIDEIRINHKTDYSTMLKEGLINKEEFSFCIKEMSIRIKNQYEQDGFRTDFKATINTTQGLTRAGKS